MTRWATGGSGDTILLIAYGVPGTRKFYAHYKEPSGQKLTLEWDIGDQQAVVAAPVPLWKSNGDWSYNATTDTYTGHVTFIGKPPAGTLVGLAYDMGVLGPLPAALLTDNPGLPSPITNGTVINIESLLAQLDSNLRANVVGATSAFIGASPKCKNGMFGTFSFPALYQGTTGYDKYDATTLNNIFTGKLNIVFGCLRSIELCFWRGLEITVGASDYAILFGAPLLNSLDVVYRPTDASGSGVKAGDWVQIKNWPNAADAAWQQENALCVTQANPCSGNTYFGWNDGIFPFSVGALNWMQEMASYWGTPSHALVNFPGIATHLTGFWKVVPIAQKIFTLRNNGKQ